MNATVSSAKQFDTYARYYDLLNRGKDYKVEAKFVVDLLKKHCRGCSSILELGSGTGGHAEHMASHAINVHGVDLSEQMLDQARERLKSLPPSLASKLVFTQGDMRNLRLDQTFDAVVSLFHVMSYQTTNDDLSAAFRTAKAHLKPDGVFVFDCWYGPAVLTDRPIPRIKKWEDDKISVTRIAEPKIYPNDNCVDVNYTIFVQDKRTMKVEEIAETHRMRYLFQPEIKMMAQQAGLLLQESQGWISGREPGFDTWGVTFVLKAQ